jgi:hypothetical protein
MRFIGKQVRLDLPKKWMKFATAFSSPPSALEKPQEFFNLKTVKSTRMFLLMGRMNLGLESRLGLV